MTHHGLIYVCRPMPVRVMGTQQVVHAHNNRQTTPLKHSTYSQLSYIHVYIFKRVRTMPRGGEQAFIKIILQNIDQNGHCCKNDLADFSTLLLSTLQNRLSQFLSETATNIVSCLFSFLPFPSQTQGAWWCFWEFSNLLN